MNPSEHPESATPESGLLGTTTSEAGLPDTATPEAGLPGTTTPEAGLPGTATPEAGLPGTATPLPDTVRVRRSLVGRVTSTKMLKTVTVLVERRVKHPLYGKYMVQSKKVHAHTDSPLTTGDVVEVQECRPISKTKTWMVVKVLDRAA